MTRNPTLLAVNFPFYGGRHICISHEKKIGGHNLCGHKGTALFKLFEMKHA
jgi:hypothetical protein